MKQALIYSLKVWLTTLILGPLLATSINLFIAWYSPVYNYFGSGFIIGIYIDLIAGASIIPLLVVFWLSTFLLIRKEIKIGITKLLLTFLVVIICVVPFLVHSNPESLSWHVLLSTSYWLPSYIIVATSATWFYKLRRVSINPNGLHY